MMAIIIIIIIITIIIIVKLNSRWLNERGIQYARKR
jgi:hypothetical protein